MTKLNIIHVDMDAFYASVEQRDHPKYMNRPVVVGGNPKGRGVVCAASYEARKFGIHSAMSCKMVSRLCPDAIFLPVDMDKYKRVSREVHNIFHRYTETIEPISIDEAFLEINTGDSLKAAKKIKEDIFNKTRLTASVGVSYNKFIAKMASDMEKPDGLTIITQDMVGHILPDLPIRKIWGVGGKTEKELNNIGIFTVRDLLQYDREFLLKNWGRRAYELIQLCEGIDHRRVETNQETKSIGEETTLREDTNDMDILKDCLKEFSLAIGKRMARAKIRCRTITVKIKYHDFKTITRSVTLSNPTDLSSEIYKQSCNILEGRVPLTKQVRLIGIQVSNLVYPYEPVQISFV